MKSDYFSTTHTHPFLSKTHNCFTFGELFKNSVASLFMVSSNNLFCFSFWMSDSLITAHLWSISECVIDLIQL